MKNINLLIISGRLGGNPELKYLQSGDPICQFSIANSESWKNDKGEKQEKTMWVPCVAWGKQAEGLAKILKKGMAVTVEGSLVIRKYNDKDGAQKYATECNVGFGCNVEITGWPKGTESARGEESQVASAPSGDDDLPF
jgi:single-strand DNA-binding protein